MKPSKLRHPLAVLRQVCGLGQKEMAERVGRSTITIQKVENKGLALSEDLARRISHETGIALSWLLDGNAKVAPATVDGRPFTREIYERHRARKQSPRVRAGLNSAPLENFRFYGPLRAVLASASKRGDYELAAYRVDKLLTELAAEFGQDASVYANDSKTVDLRRSVSLMKSELEEAEGFVDGIRRAGVFGANLPDAKAFRAAMPPASKQPSRRPRRKV